MASLNKVFLIGNLTRDPEMRYTSSGMAICHIGLAVNRRFRTARGEDRDDTCFVEIDVWGKQAESCNQYLRKGAPAFVEGRLNFDQWEDRETGRKRSRLTVTAERVQFLGQPARADFGEEPRQREAEGWGDGPPQPQAQSGPPAPAPPQRPQQTTPQPPQGCAQGPEPGAPRQAAGSQTAAPQMPPFDPVEESDDDIPF